MAGREEPVDHAAGLVHGVTVTVTVTEAQRGVRGGEHRVDLKGREADVQVGDLTRATP
ncbi:hypothetical protein [Streptomyces flavidovirens]|uniref:hypothetical protein n=1 Tax=Streptomyces flavidovirens TaxID=67298 RepID=UPI0036CF20E1